MLSSRRQSKGLSTKFTRQLNLYATAASATGVGLLALAQSANAKVVYTPANVSIAPNTTYNLDLNNDGTTDFSVLQHSYPGYSATLTVGHISNGVVARPGPASCNCDSAFALPAGISVGPGKPFDIGGDMAKIRKFQGSIESFGQWRDANARFLGLRFKINGVTHYGWARFNVQASYATGVSATLTGYAYETLANTAILTGKTSGTAGSDMERDDSLGSLAMGAAH